jgi:uncharacterized protein (DUF2236 family)
VGEPGDEGYFARGASVLRRVHRERVVGWLYGQRSLLLQATHPLAFAGLSANTDGKDMPFRRLAHTAQTMEVVFFGSREEADRETARVRRLHEHVKGKIEAPAGPHPAGSAYRATDPEFLLWILGCLADSAQDIYERFVRRLSDGEREGFWQDYLLVGELFGLEREHAPVTYADYRAYMDERLASEDLFVIDEAREIALKVAFELPLPAYRRPALSVINFMVLGSLPERVRELYGLRWGARQERGFEALARTIRLSRPFTPRVLRRGSSWGDYELVARTEARRLERAA